MLLARQARCWRGRRGATAVEFALIINVLMFLVLVCIDFGRFAYTYVAVTNAARAGAEYAMMNPYLSTNLATWQGQVLQKARDEMNQQVGYNPNNLTFTPQNAPAVIVEQTNGTDNGLRRVRVDVTYNSFTTLIPWPGIPRSVSIRRWVVVPMIR